MLLFGVAYYDEYMPYERLQEDIRMMKEANINVVRIAESTWSTLEPQKGIFDFTHIDRVLDAMYENNIKVIVGTPTYAVPTWLVKEYPDVLAMTSKGQNKYGPRQNMNITHPAYRYYSERVIRKLLGHVQDHPGIIGYQVDNETKHYQVSGDAVQLQFVKYMKNKFISLDEINFRFGLDYWSNRINAWEDFPNVDETINPSLKGEFEKFRRNLVTEFLAWQVGIVNEYKKEGQFVTHNFDFEWRGYSYGIQPDVNHVDASKAMDIAGCDIYHPSQDDLTGLEIAMCGDITRSMKNGNYLVLETEAQGFAGWVPYPNQLRQQAFSHIASGATLVEYWHWHSIHNACETYWKGLLSHDFMPNPTYLEAKTIGTEFEQLSKDLDELKVVNDVAIMYSNISLTAIHEFKRFRQDMDYNDQVKTFYKALYENNIGCDFITEDFSALDQYKMILVPSLYASSDEVLERLNAYVENGGHIVYSLRSGFCDEYVKVRHSVQPGIISKACGLTYNQFVDSKNIGLKGMDIDVSDGDNVLSGWIELLIPQEKTEVLAYYDHPYWGEYAAITHNQYGQGSATYIGCTLSDGLLHNFVQMLLKKTQLRCFEIGMTFPIIVRKSINKNKEKIAFVFNYSMKEQNFSWPYTDGVELIENKIIKSEDKVVIQPWDFIIVKYA
jgi:beta-galactosidase